MTEGVLLIFSKVPVAGQVKRRLIPHVGKAEATRIYKLLVTLTLDAAAESDFSHIELHCYPTINHPFIRDCSSKYNLALHQQQGRHLGERMYNALAHALQNHSFAVIAGCDCPLLSGELLNEVNYHLQHGCSTVLGPCEDGGYYLIGVKATHRSLFVDIEWGEDSVMETTRARLRSLGESWYETGILWDVDRIEDYDRLQYGQYL